MKSLTGLIIFAYCLPGLASVVTVQEKPRILRREELPRRTYPLKGKVLEILKDKALLDRLSAEVAGGLRADLEKYDIPVKPVLRSHYQTLMMIHMYRNEYEQALAHIVKINELNNLVIARLDTLFAESWVKARRQAGDALSPAFRKVFEQNYAEGYARLPYAEIALAVERSKLELMLANPEVTLGAVEAQLQPMLDKAGGLVDEDVVVMLLSIKCIYEHWLPLKDEMLRVTNNLIEANAKATPNADIWAARSVALTAAEAPVPIVVGVWDAGVDMRAVPAINRFVNPREVLDGKDNDGNGYVDDIHGIAYDLANSKKSVGTLDDPTGKIKSDVKRLQALAKGLLDLQSGIQSPEAAELQRTIASFTREQVKEFQEFQEELTFYTAYSHGTHVAGIVTEGNPAAKVLGARMTRNYQVRQDAYTKANAEFVAQMYKDMVAYFKKQGVRVVNMSWRYDMIYILRSLEVNGIGKDAGERWEMAESLFEIENEALYEAIKDAPEILFICASGNEGMDADFIIPASFDLPNLLTIGAVDKTGKKTSFTNTGESVDFYANGFEVESVVPGGDRLKMSGTSMAAPQVANLAAKLLAVNPRLTPTDLIRLIAAGAEPSPEDPKVRLINPRKSLGLARR